MWRAPEDVVDKAKINTTAEDKRDFGKWKMMSGQTREKLGMRADAAPWTRTAKLTGLQQTPRMLDVIDCCWQHSRVRAGVDVPPDQVKRGLWCDPSQSVHRLPVSYSVPSLCQKTLPYSFERDVCLSGRDVLNLQGFPSCASVAPPHAFSDKELRSLAGEAFFLPSASSIIYPFYLNPKAPWWQETS